jgi:P4 family phage/plasmid primase-like protien
MSAAAASHTKISYLDENGEEQTPDTGSERLREIATLLLSHEGASLVFSEKVRGNLYLTETTGTGYVWNQVKRLWIKVDAVINRASITEVLCPLIEDHLRHHRHEIYVDEEIAADTVKRLKKLAKEARSTPWCSNVFQKVIPKLYTSGWDATLNKSSHELPLKDGMIINLKTLNVRQRTRADMWSIECPVKFLPTADLTPIDEYMQKLFLENKDMTIFMQKLLGYFLTGETTDRSMYFFHGTGKNGKSKLMNIVKSVMGQFYATLSPEALLDIGKTKSGPNPALMPLKHARLAVMNDTGSGEVDARIVKAATGGDAIAIRGLYEREYSETTTQAKLVDVSNQKKTFDAEDKAMVDRIKMIPYGARFDPTAKESDELDEFVSGALDRFATWMIRGSAEWYGSGKDLCLPAPAEASTKALVHASNTIDQFLGACCELTSVGAEAPSALRSAYVRWCQDAGTKACSPQKFGQAMVSRFGQIKPRPCRYIGVRLSPAAESESQEHQRLLPGGRREPKVDNIEL